MTKPVVMLDASESTWQGMVPEHLQAGLSLYMDEGIIPGSFLSACLSNNLVEAVSRADWTMSLAELRMLMQFLFTCAPAESWGDTDRVTGWKGNPQREGLLRAGTR